MCSSQIAPVNGNEWTSSMASPINHHGRTSMSPLRAHQTSSWHYSSPQWPRARVMDNDPFASITTNYADRRHSIPSPVPFPEHWKFDSFRTAYADILHKSTKDDKINLVTPLPYPSQRPCARSKTRLGCQTGEIDQTLQHKDLFCLSLQCSHFQTNLFGLSVRTLREDSPWRPDTARSMTDSLWGVLSASWINTKPALV
jgi:hypothetical protein